MNQLGKNLILSLCIVATLLVIIGLKRKFSDGDAALLSQPSEDVDPPAPTTAKTAPRPRVLQATPAAQHDQAFQSPTSPQYTDSEVDPSQASGLSIAPIPSTTPSLKTSPRPLDVPKLVPVGVEATSPVEHSIDDEGPDPTAAIETPPAPGATRPSSEFVVTDAEDSFWSISKRVYGTGVYYRALFRHNEATVLRPDQLRAGIEVKTPPLEVLREKYPADFPTDTSSAP